MRKFSSHGHVDKDLHFYVPREELVQKACTHLVGEEPEKEGHYITVWGPGQCGKSWIMHEVLWKLQKDDRFHVLKLNMEDFRMSERADDVISAIANEIIQALGLEDIRIPDVKEFDRVFKKETLSKPLILIMDRFDTLPEETISGLAGVFRNIYNFRRDDLRPQAQKEYLLHGLALIGLRDVKVRNPPFNIQRNMHVPNLTYQEVDSMFKWYEQESGQQVKQAVIERLFYETRGQPGLISWFGELLTEGYEDYTPDHSRPVTMEDFEEVFTDAVDVLSNNTVLNIISKAKQEHCKDFVLELFKTREKIPFKFDDSTFKFADYNAFWGNGRKPFEADIRRFSSQFSE